MHPRELLETIIKNLIAYDAQFNVISERVNQVVQESAPRRMNKKRPIRIMMDFMALSRFHIIV
jgi:hypothetical protein